jgi:hypothetical protein
MKMKRILIFLLILLPVILSAQDQENIKNDPRKLPVLSINTDRFSMTNLSFNWAVPGEKEEILEVEFALNNLIDDPQNLYIFIIATYESHYYTKSSFERPSLEDREKIKVINTFPEDVKNFEYTYKDEKGNEVTEYLKYPKNIKAGINPGTGEPYKLNERLIFRSYHPFKDLKKYKNFNEISILIFDEKENLIFRDFFHVKPMKR